MSRVRAAEIVGEKTDFRVDNVGPVHGVAKKAGNPNKWAHCMLGRLI